MFLPYSREFRRPRARSLFYFIALFVIARWGLRVGMQPLIFSFGLAELGPGS
jgi:hypothetical protein